MLLCARNLILVLLTFAFTSSVAVAQKSGSITIEGQLVCSICWFEADRKTVQYGTQADVDCAKECFEKGIPPAIAVKDGDDYTLYTLEKGKFGQKNDEWLESLGKWVKASGKPRTDKDKLFLAVDEFKVVRSSIASSAGAEVVGTEVPLALKDLVGVEQKLSGYNGKIVVLNFWATWCIPCKKEMPDLAAIQNSYAPFGVQVVGASADPLADRAKVLEFVKAVRINFPVWLGATTADMERFGLGTALPGTVIVGRDGKIVSVTTRPVTERELQKQLDALLKVNEVGFAEKSNTPADVSLVPS
jgi:thiol-disulfide isomerase/thioredoxin